MENRKVLVDILGELFRQREAAEWLKELEAIGVPAAPINTIDQVFEDPQVQARAMKIEVPSLANFSLPLMGFPIKIPTSQLKIRYEPPFLGESTDQILREVLRYDDEMIEALRADQII